MFLSNQIPKFLEKRVKQDGRPPPAYFPCSNFAKGTFKLKKEESVFSKEQTFFQIENILISSKDSAFSWIRYNFMEWYHLKRLLQQICHV